MDKEDRERLAYYRATAQKLRRLAAAVTVDVRRRAQLLALANGFERAAERLKASAELD